MLYASEGFTHFCDSCNNITLSLWPDRIFQFDNFSRTKKRVLSREGDEEEGGAMVREGGRERCVCPYVRTCVLGNRSLCDCVVVVIAVVFLSPLSAWLVCDTAHQQCP